MALLTIRRTKSKKQRAASAAGQAGSAAVTFLKARLAWIAGKKVTKVAVPAAAAGTAAVVAKKRFSRDAAATEQDQPVATTGVNSVPQAPAGVA
jgi:hypothetical protein